MDTESVTHERLGAHIYKIAMQDLNDDGLDGGLGAEGHEGRERDMVADASRTRYELTTRSRPDERAEVFWKIS